MKRIKYIIIVILIAMFYLPIGVFAKGGFKLNANEISIEKGSGAAITITADNMAGRVDISSSDTDVVTVSENKLFLDSEIGKKKDTTFKIEGISVGESTIKVYVTDAASYDEEDLTGKEYKIKVTVVEPTVALADNKDLDKTTKNPKTGLNSYLIGGLITIAIVSITGGYLLKRHNKFN